MVPQRYGCQDIPYSKSAGSLALLLVAFLGRGLGLLPPLRVVRVPVDRRLQARLEIRVPGLPAQLRAQLCRIDRIPAVMPRAVLDVAKGVLRPAHEAQDHAQHVDVVPLAVSTDQIRLADTPLRQDRPHRGGMVLGVDPVAHVQARAIQFRAHAGEDVRDLTRDELLHMLVGAVGVGAVRDGGAQAVGARPCAHEHVGARLGGRIRA